LLATHVDALRAAFRDIRQHHPFTIDAIVVLPDHLHAIWTLPDGDADFATRWRLIKATFSRNVSAGECVSASRAARGERSIWQPAIGNIRSATKKILKDMWTTSTSIPSSMGWYAVSRIGNIRRSTAWSSRVSIPKIGRAMWRITVGILVSGGDVR
jgi:REP element-mobilizing transposase RayT